MSAAQEDRLRGLIARGAPISMAYRALWTRQAVRALIAGFTHEIALVAEPARQ